jgi:hypothetical protein
MTNIRDEETVVPFERTNDAKTRKRKPNGSASHGGMPDLIINEADPTATAKELATLIAQRDDFLFNGHMPVRVVVEADYLPRALEISIDMIRVFAHEICNPVKLRKHSKISVPLSKDIASLYLNGLEGSWGLKAFRGITTAPVLDHDGSIRVAVGYDGKTGLWCHNIPHIVVPNKPIEREAKSALVRLRRFFQTFPFADSDRVDDPDLGVEVTDLAQPPGLDESIFICALLTAICRPSLELAPGFLCDAPSLSGAGTGKGLLVKSICIIASGVGPAAFTSGHDAAEFDKRLTAALTEAHPAVFLDNFNAKELKSDILASTLTESKAMVRVMGQTKNVPLHTRTFVGITGNGVEIAEDMARRLLKTHLDAQMEDPERRKFEPGFLDRVLTSRSDLLSAALTIWRWGRQNKLHAGKSLGSYEVWARWCRDPLLALGLRDPVDRIAEIKAADPRRRAVVAVFDVWWAMYGDKIMKSSDLGIEVLQLIDEKATFKVDGSIQFSRQRVSAFLVNHTGTRIDGYLLSKSLGDSAPSKPVWHYKLEQDDPTPRMTFL